MNGVMGGADRWLHVLVTMELKGVALLALCALGALALRRRSAAGRHWVWLLGMTGLLALPLVQAVGPRLAAPLPAWVAVDAADAPAWTRSPAAAAPRAARTEEPAGAAAPDGFSPSAAPGVTPSAAGNHQVESPAPTPSTTTRRGVASRPVVAAAEAGSPSDRTAWLRRIPVGLFALAIWTLGTLILLGSVVASIVATWRLAGDSLPFAAGPVTELAEDLARELRVRRRVRLLEGTSDAMPMSWGWLRPVILLPAGAEHWPRRRLESVLLHELAHVRRSDCLTQVLAEMAVALHWMNPLAWLAARRLRVEREYACDDLVLNTGTGATEYAGELLSLARSFRTERGTALAAVAMARSANLPGRLRAVLDATRQRTFGRRGTIGAAAVAAVLVVTLAALAPAAEAPGTEAPAMKALVRLPQSTTCGMDPDGWQNISSQSNNGHRRIEWSKPGCEVDVRIEGDIEFNDDFTDVDRMDRDGRFSIEEQDGRVQRRLDITPASGGRPEYAYSVDRKDQAFDGAARDWYRGMLTQLFRRTGFMAHERARAILQQGGVPALLRELDQLSSDYGFATYVQELLKQADLSDAQAMDVVKRARDRVESDYYMASILQAFAPKHLTSDEMVDQYLAAASTMDSDYYRAAVLGTALKRGDLSTRQVGSILRAASGMDSDYYIATVLTEVAQQYKLAPDMRTVYLKAVTSMDSDYYRSTVLGALMKRNDLTQDELAMILEAAATISSATYATNVLDEVASRDLSSDELRAAYLQVAVGLESDYHRAQALGTLLKKTKLTGEQVAQVAAAAAKIESDYYKSTVLVDVVRRYKVEGATRQAVIDAMNTIESSYYRGQVAQELLRT